MNERETEQISDAWSLEEIAALPPGPQREAACALRRTTMTEQERQTFDVVLHENDALRHDTIAEVALPVGVLDRLREIPDAAPRLGLFRRLMKEPLGWKQVAALLVVSVGLWWVYGIATAPFVPRPLDAATAQSITRLAMAHQQSGPTLEYRNSDRDKVLEAINLHKMPFAVMIPDPGHGYELVGEGTCKLGDVAAVFTQWKGDGTELTLYQFDGRPLGAPLQFIPAEGPTDTQHSVTIWSGVPGPCTWVVVINAPGKGNPFQYGTGTAAP